MTNETRLSDAFVAAGVSVVTDLADIRPTDYVVVDASTNDPQSSGELGQALREAFTATQRAFLAEVPILYVLDEASLYGHTSGLRSALNTGLLGGLRTAAMESSRSNTVANAVTVDDGVPVAEIVTTCYQLLADKAARGRVISCGILHLGRPSA